MRDFFEKHEPEPQKMTVNGALGAILDAVDYLSGACRPNEMVGAVLPAQLLRDAKAVLVSERSEFEEFGDGEMNPLYDTEAENDKMRDSLQKIYNWSQAYPLDIFPEPDMKKVAQVLSAAGISLDDVSGYCMRHVVSGFENLAKEGLGISDGHK